MKRVAIQIEDFDVGAELARLEAAGGGAVTSFTGVVRGDNALVSLELQHYPAMTAAQVERIIDEATARWPLLAVRVIHRFGKLKPGEHIVFVGTASRHRAAALESCAFLIDWLKSDAPFWKKEHFADGSEGGWVDAKESDDRAREAWS